MVPTKKKWNLTIRKKLLLVSLLLLLTPVLVLGIISYRVTFQETDGLIRKNLSNNVRMAIEMTASLEQQVKKGELTKEEAQENMKQLLLGPKQGDQRAINSHIDMGKSGYFFVLNEKGDLLAHPLLEGQNIAEKQTSDGFFYIKDMIQKGLNGGGFTTYMWPLPDSTKEAEKSLMRKSVAIGAGSSRPALICRIIIQGRKTFAIPLSSRCSAAGR